MIQAIASTVMSFVVWSGVVYGFFVLRNKTLEYKLKRLIRPERTDPEEDRVHVICANGTDVRVTIRDVRLITEDDTHVSMTYIGDTGDVIHPRKRGDVIARRRNTLINRHQKAGLVERDFVELPAQTAGLWALTSDLVDDSQWQFAQCILVIDYPTLLNTRRLMVVNVKDSILADLNRDFHDYITNRRLDPHDDTESATPD